MRVTPWSLISAALMVVTGLMASKLGFVMREPVTTTSDSEVSEADSGAGTLVSAATAADMPPAASVLANKV